LYYILLREIFTVVNMKGYGFC